MKKMSMFALLLAAVVATSYSVSGTYAKYTSSSEGTDSARVAKWGINMENVVDLFASDYTDVKSADNGDGTFDNVVAPGTEGSYTFTIDGAPETNYTLEVDVTGTDTIGQIVYTLDKDTDAEQEFATIEELAAAIDQLYDPAKVYAANTSTESEHTIGWYWTFEENDDDTTTDINEKDTNNTTDTNLGNDGTGEVSLTVKITAVQTEAAPTNN